MGGILDAFVAYKFVKLLSTPFDKTDAYKLGIIDEKGKILIQRKNLRTGKEKVAYTIFHTLAWNMKKLLAKFPPTRSRLGSFAAALYLLKEECQSSDNYLIEHTFMDFLHTNGYELNLMEDVLSEATLKKGDYVLVVDVDTAKAPAKQGDIVNVDSDLESFSTLLGKPLFKETHIKSNKQMVVSNDDLERI